MPRGKKMEFPLELTQRVRQAFESGRTKTFFLTDANGGKSSRLDAKHFKVIPSGNDNVFLQHSANADDRQEWLWVLPNEYKKEFVIHHLTENLTHENCIDVDGNFKKAVENLLKKTFYLDVHPMIGTLENGNILPGIREAVLAKYAGDDNAINALFSKLEKENNMVNPSGFGLPRPQAAAAAAAAPKTHVARFVQQRQQSLTLPVPNHPTRVAQRPRAACPRIDTAGLSEEDQLTMAKSHLSGTLIAQLDATSTLYKAQMSEREADENHLAAERNMMDITGRIKAQKAAGGATSSVDQAELNMATGAALKAKQDLLEARLFVVAAQRDLLHAEEAFTAANEAARLMDARIRAKGDAGSLLADQEAGGHDEGTENVPLVGDENARAN